MYDIYIYMCDSEKFTFYQKIEVDLVLSFESVTTPVIS